MERSCRFEAIAPAGSSTSCSMCGSSNERTGRRHDGSRRSGGLGWPSGSSGSVEQCLRTLGDAPCNWPSASSGGQRAASSTGHMPDQPRIAVSVRPDTRRGSEREVPRWTRNRCWRPRVVGASAEVGQRGSSRCTASGNDRRRCEHDVVDRCLSSAAARSRAARSARGRVGDPPSRPSQSATRREATERLRRCRMMT